MVQSTIHEGYEYQDYLTVSIILKLMIQQTDAEIIIDRKAFDKDKFDDLKVKTAKDITEYQIKYSDEDHSHILRKDDFSNGNGHDIALTDLYNSWKTRKDTKTITNIKLCLAWDRPSPEDPISQYLQRTNDDSLPFDNVSYSFDGQLFWLEGKNPPKTWKKFNSAINAGQINRDDFLSFCKELSIILEMPKASLDLKKPDSLEKVLLSQASKLGIGIYPNDHIDLEQVIYTIAAEVKSSRAKGNKIFIDKLIYRLGLTRDYGKFNQCFPVDTSHQIILKYEIKELHRVVIESKRVILTGNPGAGKSWLVEEYINKLEKDNIKFIRYNCFLSLQDENRVERIRYTSLYGNLISQLIEKFPKLRDCKITTYGADKTEFENLLKHLKEDLILIVDGLDHISREYELNKDSLSQSETEIISELLQIHFSNNCHVIISSQPIDILNVFKKQKYTLFEIKPWGIKQIRSLMSKYHIKDYSIHNKSYASVSEYLLKKSQGNALYLSYVLRQLQNATNKLFLIDDIPDYDLDLSNYYKYLFSRLRNSSTVNALCGADFYLSENDLTEITGCGDFVKEDLLSLHPLLAENSLYGGFSIYHESFRRYLLSLLKSKHLDLGKNVFGPIIDWLQQKNFFEFDKAYYFLPKLLYKNKLDQENIKLIDKEFILKSIAEGYSRNSIRNNLNYIIKSASRAKDLIALVESGELFAMLEDLNDFECTGEAYFKSICSIKGADKLNKMLQNSGNPTFDVSIGLLACYVLSKSGYKPNWNLYLDKDNYNSEYDKYYYRNLLDEYGEKIIPEIMEFTDADSRKCGNNIIQVAYNEIIDFTDIDSINLIAEKRKLSNWRDYLSFIKTGYIQKYHSYTTADLNDNWVKIKNIKAFFEKDSSLIQEFFSKIYFLAKKNEKNEINNIIADCENINWYFNWIIYSVKMAELLASKDKFNTDELCQSVISNLEILISDLDPFKGTPRTCDISNLQNVLMHSYEQALSIIVNQGSLKDLRRALDILLKVSDETQYSLQNIKCGPLTYVSLFKLISRFITENNHEIMIPYLTKIMNHIKSNSLYDEISEIYLRYACLINDFNKNEAIKFLETGIRYLIAYGFHKDIILEQVLDSYNVFYDSVSDNYEDERDAITKMSVAVVRHTDGKDTKHFRNIWFDKLLDTEPEYALSFLQVYQEKFGRSWVVNNMIRSVITKYCNDLRFINLTIGLIESLPNDTSPQIIKAATSVLNNLNRLSTEKEGEERLFAKHWMNELVTNIVSRFNTFVPDYGEIFGEEHESIFSFLLAAKSACFDVEQYINYFNTQSANKNTFSYSENQPDFDNSSLQSAQKWLTKYYLTENNLHHVYEFLKQFLNDKNTLFELIRIIIVNHGWWFYNQKHKKLILQLIYLLNLSEDDLAKVHMLLYLNSGEWGSSLVDKDEFEKSIKYNKELAWEYFYNEVADIIISHSGRITKGLLVSLKKISYDRTVLALIWKKSFEIMKLRFPNLEDIPLEPIVKCKDIKAGIRNCMLMRFNDGGKEEFLATYAYIANCGEEHNYSEFSDSLLFCLEHFDCFNLVTQIAIADLLIRYGNNLDKENKDRLIIMINKVYPVGNLVVDYLFFNISIFKDFAYSNDSIFNLDLSKTDVLNYYLSEKLYTLGQQVASQDYDVIDSRSIVYSDSIMLYLDRCGLNCCDLYKKLHKSKALSEIIEDYYLPSCPIVEKNTIYKSYEIQYALHDIIKKAIIENSPELIINSFYFVIPEYFRMYCSFKCRDIQPSRNINKKINYIEPFIYLNGNDYIQIGSFEKRLQINNTKSELLLLYEGIVPDDGVSRQIPFDQYFVFNLDLSNYMNLESKNSLIILNQIKDPIFDDDFIICPCLSLHHLLDVRIFFDYKNARYVGVDRDNNIVYYIKKWSSCYRGNSEFTGNEIPLYQGVSLYIKKDYIKKIEHVYGNLKIKNDMKSYSQSF